MQNKSESFLMCKTANSEKSKSQLFRIPAAVIPKKSLTFS